MAATTVSSSFRGFDDIFADDDDDDDTAFFSDFGNGRSSGGGGGGGGGSGGTSAVKAYLDDTALRRLTGRADLSTATVLTVQVDAVANSLGDAGHRLPALRELRLNGSVVGALRDLGTSLRHVTVLFLGRCALECLGGAVTTFPALEELYVAFNAVSDLSPLAYLPRLRALDAECNAVASMDNVRFLAACPRLTSLSLQGNPVARYPRYRHDTLEALTALELLDDLDVDSAAASPSSSHFSPEAAAVAEDEDAAAAAAAAAALSEITARIDREAEASAAAAALSSSSSSSSAVSRPQPHPPGCAAAAAAGTVADAIGAALLKEGGKEDGEGAFVVAAAGGGVEGLIRGVVTEELRRGRAARAAEEEVAGCERLGEELRAVVTRVKCAQFRDPCADAVVCGEGGDGEDDDDDDGDDDDDAGGRGRVEAPDPCVFLASFGSTSISSYLASRSSTCGMGGGVSGAAAAAAASVSAQAATVFCGKPTFALRPSRLEQQSWATPAAAPSPAAPPPISP